MKCFYHNPDLDGHCSGAIVKKRYPDCEMIGINYGDKFPWETIQENETVFMVDFCLQPFSDMIKLNKICNLIWIDHHKSAIEEYNKTGIGIEGLRDLNYAGCELTWQYIYPNTTAPRAVYLLGRYDIWKHEEDPNIINFQYGMQQYEDTTPENGIWNSLLKTGFKNYLNSSYDYSIDEIIEDGKLIKKYQDSQNAKRAKQYAFETVIDGHKAIAINAGMVGSPLFDSLWDENKYDIMMPFTRKLGTWTVSLYSTKENIDCSQIAKKYGGGGHKGASGFQTKDLPFKH